MNEGLIIKQEQVYEYKFRVGNITGEGVTLIDTQYNLIQLPKSILPIGSSSGSVIKLTVQRDVQSQIRSQQAVNRLIQQLEAQERRGNVVGVGDEIQQNGQLSIVKQLNNNKSKQNTVNKAKLSSKVNKQDKIIKQDELNKQDEKRKQQIIKQTQIEQKIVKRQDMMKKKPKIQQNTSTSNKFAQYKQSTHKPLQQAIKSQSSDKHKQSKTQTQNTNQDKQSSKDNVKPTIREKSASRRTSSAIKKLKSAQTQNP